MLMDLSATAYGKAAVAPAPMLTYTAPAPEPVPMPTHTATTDLLDHSADWSWEQLRDYVLRAVTERHGPQPQADPAKQAAIFKGFHARWGTKAGAIARFAFEQQDGYWRSAPITPTRFCRGSDPYFAQPIAERLTA